MKKKNSLRFKIVIFMLPLIVMVFLAVFLITSHNTNKVVLDNTYDQISLSSDSIEGRVSEEVSATVGILDNVQQSIELSCNSNKEIQEYLYSIADAYPDIIPAGIYCGMVDGTYIDKMWKPDADWVMKERPWYVDGLKADKVTFGEAYLDSNSGKYIASVFANIKNKNGKVIGVISADVQLDSIVEMLEKQKILDNGYAYIVDSSSGIIIGNSVDEDSNGKEITKINNEVSDKITDMLADKEYGELELVNGQYIYLSKVKNTNFVSVCQVPESDVKATVASVERASLITSIIGIFVLCIASGSLLTYLLRPMKDINKMVNAMHGLDITHREKVTTSDEMGMMVYKLNNMSDQIQQTLLSIKESARMLDEKAHNNGELAGDLNTSAKTQSEQMHGLTESMGELSNAITMIAEGATTLADNVSKTNSAASNVKDGISGTVELIENSKTSMEQITDNMQVIVKDTDELEDSVNNLYKGLDGISQMVNVIQDIVEQTNLLSLNASIEAARAGEAGMGFAVVAEEIHKLADNCSGSVADITTITVTLKDLVEIVRKKTMDNKTAINDSSNVIKDATLAFDNINTTMHTIENEMNTVTDAFKSVDEVAMDIVAGTQEQTASTQMILNTCESVMSISDDFEKNGMDMHESSEELRELSVSLNDEIDKFTLGEDN